MFWLKACWSHRVSSRSPWKHILNHQDLVLNNIHYKLQGDSTWSDIWFGDGPLHRIFPKHFVIGDSKYAFVENSAWSPNFRRNLKEEEISEWASLNHLILNVTHLRHEVSSVWKLENSGFFFLSFKSLYTQLISSHPLNAQTRRFVVPQGNWIPHSGR